MGERIPLREVAKRLGIKAGTYRYYVSTQGAPLAVGRESGRSGEDIYDWDSVNAWNAARGGAGARTDRHVADATKIATRIRAAWPPVDRDVHTHTFDTPDGVRTVVEWTPGAVWVTVHWLPGLPDWVKPHFEHPGDDRLIRRLAVTLRHVRKARAKLAPQQEADARARRVAWSALRDAADRVDRERATEGRHGLMDAYEARRHAVRAAAGVEPPITDQDIADAARMPLSDVERETHPLRQR